jgi:signal peptidase
MKAGRVVLRALLIIVISVTIGLTVYTWNARRMFHNELPMPFGVGAAIVLTGSMEPTLNVNDLVIVTKADNIEIGDIVVFQQGNDLIIHRVIEKNVEENRIVTKGDANNVDDGNIPMSAVKGKLSFSVPFVGLVVKGLKSVPGIIIVLGLSAFLMIRSWKNERKESDKDLDKIRAEIAKLKGEGDTSSPDAIAEQIRQLKEQLAQNGENTQSRGEQYDNEKE